MTSPDVGIVLVNRPADAVAADAPLTGQACHVVPLGARWSWLAWDGTHVATPLPTVAEVLSAGEAEPVLACWWAPGRAGFGPGRAGFGPGRAGFGPSRAGPGPSRAGFVLAHRGKLVAGHEWGGGAPATDGSMALAAARLSEAFRVPAAKPEIRALLPRTDADVRETLHELLTILRAPTEPVGLDQDALVAMAAAAPGSVHTPKLSRLAAVRHAYREAPPTNELEGVLRCRPWWWRASFRAGGIALAVATVVMFVGRYAWDLPIPWWLQVAGVVFTPVYLYEGRRPRRPR